MAQVYIVSVTPIDSGARPEHPIFYPPILPPGVPTHPIYWPPQVGWPSVPGLPNVPPFGPQPSNPIMLPGMPGWGQIPGWSGPGGGAPIYPGDPNYPTRPQPQPPLGIWGPPTMPPGYWGGGMGPGVKPQPHPEHPIVIPPGGGEPIPLPPDVWEEIKEKYNFLFGNLPPPPEGPPTAQPVKS